MTRSKSGPSASVGCWCAPEGRRRRRMLMVAPAATVSRYQNAHLVPRRSGLTVAAPLTVGLVVAKQQRRPDSAGPSAADHRELTQEGMADADRRRPGSLNRWPWGIYIPRPGIAEPQRWEHMQHGSIRARIGHLDGHEHISGVRFCVVDVDNPVAVIIECAGVDRKSVV